MLRQAPLSFQAWVRCRSVIKNRRDLSVSLFTTVSRFKPPYVPRGRLTGKRA